jgi:D-lyxose ketol-isomerase
VIFKAFALSGVSLYIHLVSGDPMKASEAAKIRKEAARLLKHASLAATRKELAEMEVADFGLDDVRSMGLELIVYENNDRYCAKELVLLPRQTCPEHRHPPLSESNPGKRETFRCRWGTAYLYVPGAPTAKPRAKLPKVHSPHFTVWHEIIMRPGDQYTLPPGTLHWFQAGPRGAVVSEFSSSSVDDADVFTDPRIRRMPVYE